MQLLLPLFPHTTKLITPTLGVFEEKGTVFYLHSGVPVDLHVADDLKSFRRITSKLIHLGQCNQKDIVDTFHVSEDSVRRSLKLFKEKGEKGFLGEEKRHGVCHKMLPDRLSRIQGMLDVGKSNYAIAKKERISESTIRYSIQAGKLKKKCRGIPFPSSQ